MSSDMLREVSDSLFEYLIDAFPPNRSYSLSDIEQDPMPPLLAHFLTHSLQHRLDIEVEHLRSVRSPWFDYDHSEVQQNYKAFVASLARHSHIPAEEWRATLKRATKLVIAHLVLPTHTLVEYIFHDGEGPLPAPLIYRHLTYFAAYPYLREAVETFLKQRQLKELDRTRFSSLLAQIDKHMTANYEPHEWIRMLKPMFDLMRRVPFTNRQGVPLELLAMFFGDKDAYEIQERLLVEKELHRSALINDNLLRKIIEGSVEPFIQQVETVSTPAPVQTTPPAEPPPRPAPVPHQPPPPPPKEEVVQQTAPQPAQEAHFLQHTINPKETSQPAPMETPAPVQHAPEPAPAASPVAKPPAESEKPKPLWEQFQQTGAPDEKQPEQNGSPAPEPSPANAAMPLWMQFQKNADSKEALSPSSRMDRAGQAPASPPSPTVPNASATAPSTPIPQPVSDSPETSPSTFAHGLAPDPAPPVSRPISKPVTLEQLEFSVLGLYGSSNRQMFIDNLFAGSPQEYQQLLQRLDAIENWTQASALIAENVFKKHNVNIYSPAAIMFTESVEEQYKIS